MTTHVSRCFMGSSEEIAAHHKLVADAKAMGGCLEAHRIADWLERQAQDFEIRHEDIVAAIRSGEYLR